MNNHIPLYVLNSFLKFERKLYQVFGLPLGRPIRFKSIIYAVVIGVIELVIYFTPIIGNLINWIPVGILIIIPIGLAWLLADIGTEDRSPMSYFKSFIAYQIRKIKGNSYYRNREVQKEREYSFHNYITYVDVPKVVERSELENENHAKREQEKALRYIERITNPDEFFRRLQEEEERKKQKNRKWFFRKKALKKGA